ncbi:P-loop NTPase fold protein [Shewanella colwelliana]|uniref:P-loop NTPase fold protein n=1 Tax=Shewanella colwelliana TaxID=23 RepID=UPI0022AEF674|nr:P-loop NTPase fold protein [Shewanella colwelliana]MCZ4339321.1 hypothetical protein [Shewanella colwelliana]
MADKKSRFFLAAYLVKTILLAGAAAFISYLLSFSSLFSASSAFVSSIEDISWNLIPLFGGFIIAILLSDVKAAGQSTPLLKLFIKQLCFCSVIVLLMSVFLAASYALETTIDSLVFEIKCILLGGVILLVVVSQCYKQLWRVQHAVILSLCLFGTFLPVDILEFLILNNAGQAHLVHILGWLIFMAIGLWIGFKFKQVKSADKYDKRPDSLNRTPYVTRMTSKLCEHEGNIALIGGFGSGKTWIVDKVAARLVDQATTKLNKNNWIAVKIDGWGLQEAAISQSIISHIIQEISVHADMTAYIDLPNNYRDALKGAGSVAGVLNALANSGLKPMEQFEQINEMLATLDLNLLVAVEDLDRNNNAKILANEVASLLASLRHYHNIRFIFSVGYEPHFSDMLMKSCDFYEFLTVLSITDARKDLSELRQELLSADADLFIKDEVDENRVTFLDYCATLLDNPRLLQRHKDQTTASWSMLHGQVCIDDLLVFNTLMYCCPTAFIELIRDNNMDWIYNHSLDGMSPPDAEASEADKVEGTETTKEKKTNKQKAEESLIAYLSQSVMDEAGRSSSPQSLQYGHRDYFKLLVQGYSSSEVKDKDYLAAISVKPDELKQAETDKITEWLLLDNTFDKLALFIVWQHKNSSAVVVNWLMLLIKLYPKDKPFKQDRLNRINSAYLLLEGNFGTREPQVHVMMLDALMALDSAYFIAYFLLCGEKSNVERARAIAEGVGFNKLNGKIGRWNDEHDGWYSKAQLLDAIAKFKAGLSADDDKHLREKFETFRRSLDVVPLSAEKAVCQVEGAEH